MEVVARWSNLSVSRNLTMGDARRRGSSLWRVYREIIKGGRTLHALPAAKCAVGRSVEPGEHGIHPGGAQPTRGEPGHGVRRRIRAGGAGIAQGEALVDGAREILKRGSPVWFGEEPFGRVRASPARTLRHFVGERPVPSETALPPPCSHPKKRDAPTPSVVLGAQAPGYSGARFGTSPALTSLRWLARSSRSPRVKRVRPRPSPGELAILWNA